MARTTYGPTGFPRSVCTELLALVYEVLTVYTLCIVCTVCIACRVCTSYTMCLLIGDSGIPMGVCTQLPALVGPKCWRPGCEPDSADPPPPTHELQNVNKVFLDSREILCSHHAACCTYCTVKLDLWTREFWSKTNIHK